MIKEGPRRGRTEGLQENQRVVTVLTMSCLLPFQEKRKLVALVKVLGEEGCQWVRGPEEPAKSQP